MRVLYWPLNFGVSKSACVVRRESEQMCIKMEDHQRENSKLKLLLITHHGPNALRPRPIAMALADRGHEVTVMHTAPHRFRTDIFETEGIRWVGAPDLLWGRARTGWDPWSTTRRIAFLNRDRACYDLIHCFETRPASIYPAFAHHRKHGTPVITDWNDWWGRGGIIDHFRPWWYRFLFGRLETHYEEAFRSRVAGLTVIATALGDRAINLGVSPERILHLQGGTLPEVFKAPSKKECRTKVGISLDHPVLAFSSLNSHWDLEIVMETLAIVAQKFPNVKLIVTGKANRNLIQVAQQHRVEKHIHLTGFLPIEELPWYLGSADLFLLPFPPTIYNMGRWPNKLGDYMSIGRPTVTNPVGDVANFFQRHRIGLLAQHTPGDFADKICQLLENIDMLEEMSRNARKTSLQYTYPSLMQRLESFYRRILKMEFEAREKNAA